MSRIVNSAIGLTLLIIIGCSPRSKPGATPQAEGRAVAAVSPLDPVEEVLGEKAAPTPAATPVPAASPAATPGTETVLQAEVIEVTSEEIPAPAGKPYTTDSGLVIEDLVIGEGPAIVVGSNASIHYTGWFEDGTEFDSSRNGGRPYPVPVGQGRVIDGWEEGLIGMKAGGKRRLIIPPSLGYGDRGFPGRVPPGATLIFELECVAVK